MGGFVLVLSGHEHLFVKARNVLTDVLHFGLHPIEEAADFSDPRFRDLDFFLQQLGEGTLRQFGAQNRDALEQSTHGHAKLGAIAAGGFSQAFPNGFLLDQVLAHLFGDGVLGLLQALQFADALLLTVQFWLQRSLQSITGGIIIRIIDDLPLHDRHPVFVRHRFPPDAFLGLFA
jgi:hypothetical protein